MWARASAGIVPGFFLAAALDGLACFAWPGPWQATLVPGLIAFFPLWTAVFCASIRAPGGGQAWAWLTSLAVLGMWLLRTAQTNGWIA